MHLKDLNCWDKRKYTDLERADKSTTYPLAIIPTEEILMRKYIHAYFKTKDCAEMNTKLLQNHAQNWVFVKKKKKLGKDYAYFHFLKWCRLVRFQVNRYL